MNQIIPLFIGLAAGIASGLFGIGGGLIIVPLLILTLKFTQVEASAASLAAMLLPVSALGVYTYWKAGTLTVPHMWAALLIACGILIGTYFGARLALVLPAQTLMRVFAIFLMLVAVRIWFKAG